MTMMEQSQRGNSISLFPVTMMLLQSSRILSPSIMMEASRQLMIFNDYNVRLERKRRKIHEHRRYARD